ncbi:hypothetical protein [Scytonema sp. PRP1]|uniref:hypothetical protein n=1 Tax=Scytonema sp. PRP1 TaxID=3120513 RepID=UPI00300D35DA
MSLTFSTWLSIAPLLLPLISIARIFYKLWTTDGDYTDPGMDYYEQRYRERMVNNLHKKAIAFGFELIPQPLANTVS